MNIIYLRISTNEKRQDLDQQLKAILKKHDLKDYHIYKDQASAYKMDQIRQRKEFIKLLDILFDTKKTLIELFLNLKFERDPINLYVWDLSRIMRNIQLNLFFFILCKQFNVRIISHKDNKIYNEKDFDDPTDKMLEVITYSVDSYGAEKYSHDTSVNIKRAYDKDKGGSTKGMFWGLGMTPNTNWPKYWADTVYNNKGDKLSRLTETGRLRLTINEKHTLDQYIKKLLQMGYMRKDVIKFVAERKGILISNPYLTKNFWDIN